jgi:hypothetical protein
MVRQAHTYLAGAVSGTALIAAAVVAFVVLVSLQAIRDWPLAGIGGGSDSSAVSAGHPAAAGNTAVPTAGGAGVVAARVARSAADRNSRQLGGPAESKQQVGAATTGSSPSPAAGSPAGEAPAPNSGSGGGASGPPGQSTSSGSGSGGGGPVSSPGTGGSGQSTSGAVTGAVNNTVSGADQTVGGTLGDAGVTKVTEEVVNGVAGPESAVGETVDKVGETVGGLLPGKR